MILVALVLAANAVSTADTSSAGNFSGASGRTSNCLVNDPGGVNMQDPNPHTFFYSALTPSVASHVDWARGTLFDPTSVDTTRLGSVGTLTDVVVYDEDYTVFCGRPWHPRPDVQRPTVGLAVCVSLASGNKCEKHEVRYDLSYWNVINNDGNARRRNLACHEIGHTVGLTHNGADGGGCMPEVNTTVDRLAEHDVAHINGGWQTLYPGWSLRVLQGEYDRLVSWDGRYRAIMQTDGNFVVYGPAGPTWASNTAGWPGAYAVMQGDGNFVIYYVDAYGPFPLCSTRTGYPGTIMQMQNDGNLVLYRPGNIAIWASQSGNGCT